MTVINAEAPVALVVSDHGTISPLTRCCAASAKGSIAGDYPCVVCRNCYEEIDDEYGDCWTLEDARGWDTYYMLLAYWGSEQPQGQRPDRGKLEAIVAEGKRQAHLVMEEK